MNRHVDQFELSKIISEREGIDQHIVEKFIEQLFINIENGLTTNSSIKVDELGTFKKIKGGDSFRILFLGNTKCKPTTNGYQTKQIKVETNITKTTLAETKTSLEKLTDNPNKENNFQRLTLEETKEQSKETLTKAKNSDSAPIFTPEIDHSNRAEDQSYFSNASTSEGITLPNKKKMPALKQIILTIGICLLLIISIFYYFGSSLFVSSLTDKKKNTEKVETNGSNTETIDSNSITEIENTDKEHYSSYIVAQTDFTVEQISVMFYGTKKFWPFIYSANKNIIGSDFTIPAKSIVKIPRLTVDLVSFNKGELDKKAQELGSKIISEL